MRFFLTLDTIIIIFFFCAFKTRVNVQGKLIRPRNLEAIIYTPKLIKHW